jgi:tetratricopeptide (TPR) repeat protein
VALSNIGLLEFSAGRINEAKSLHNEALQLRRSIEDKTTASYDLEYLTLDMQRDFALQPLPSGAAKSTRSLIAKLKQHDSVDALIADSLNNLGGCLELNGELDDAAALYLEAIELRRVLFGDGNYLTAESMLNLATVLSGQGHLNQAMEVLNKVYTVYIDHYSEDSPEIATVLNKSVHILNSLLSLYRLAAY